MYAMLKFSICWKWLLFFMLQVSVTMGWQKKEELKSKLTYTRNILCIYKNNHRRNSAVDCYLKSDQHLS